VTRCLLCDGAAARLGKPAADLTEEEFRPAYHRAVIAALHGTEQA
jgi:hypothetical protein